MTKLKSPESFPSVQRKPKSMGGCAGIYYYKINNNNKNTQKKPRGEV